VNRSRLLGGFAAPALAAVAAIGVSSIAVWISGNDPVTAFQAMLSQIDSTQSATLIVNRAVPYYIAAISVAIGFKMNLFNIGVNGQYVLAAMLAAAAGAAVDLPPVLHIAMIVVIAVVVGATWAAIPAVLKAYRGVNEVISTIMLNYVATNLIAYLLTEHFRNPEQTNIRETRVLPDSARLPRLTSIFGVSLDQALFLFLPVAIALGIGYHVLLNRSRFGFDLRVSGENPTAARAAGINPRKMILITMIMSGAIAGLVGLGPLIADNTFYKYGDQFPTTFGFTGLSLALLGRNHPVGMAAAAIVWATIERATQALAFVDIPQEIGVILQGSFLLAAVIAYEVVRRITNDAETRAAARQLGGDRPPPATVPAEAPA